MDKRQETSHPVRHTRLFELIRQGNVVDEASFAAPDRSAPDLAEMQNFLKQATRSLRSADDSNG